MIKLILIYWGIGTASRKSRDLHFRLSPIISKWSDALWRDIMDLKLFNDIQKTLEHKFGRFFYETKLGKPPKPKDLIVKHKGGTKGELAFEGPPVEFGGIRHFISWFEKKHAIDADSRWDKLMKRIENLTGSKEGRVFIMQRISNLQGFVKSEIYRKDYYQKLYKAECQRHKRKQDIEIKKYEEAIKTIKELDPDFDKDRKYSNIAKDKANNLKPSQTLSTLKHFHNYGLMWATEQKQKSTKGLQTLRNFVCEVYRIAEKDSNLTPNAIYVEIKKLLDLLKIKNTNQNNYTHENIKQIIKRHYHQYTPKEKSSKLLKNS